MQLYLSLICSAFEEEEASASTRVTLFLANGSCCSLCARLERNLTNTLTLHLQPDVLVVNHCPIPIQVLELLRGEGVAEEGGRDRELVSQLDPNAVGIIAQNKVHVCTSNAHAHRLSLCT